MYLRKKAAEQIGELVVKFITKFKHYKVAICKIPNVKNGLYGRDVNNKEINEYNKKIKNIADQLKGEFQSCNVSALYYNVQWWLWEKSNRSFPKFWYMNCRSLNDKHEQLSGFLKNLDENSFLDVTETCTNGQTDIPEFYLCNSFHLVHQARSSLTNVQRGGGVAIWSPRQFTVKMRNDLNTINESFF